jgi:hypothetical protein
MQKLHFFQINLIMNRRKSDQSTTLKWFIANNCTCFTSTVNPYYRSFLLRLKRLLSTTHWRDRPEMMLPIV